MTNPHPKGTMAYDVWEFYRALADLADAVIAEVRTLARYFSIRRREPAADTDATFVAEAERLGAQIALHYGARDVPAAVLWRVGVATTDHERRDLLAPYVCPLGVPIDDTNPALYRAVDD